jgi:hypothetical protein
LEQCWVKPHVGVCCRGRDSAGLVDQHGFVLVKFAAALKAMTRTLLGEIGYDGAVVER